MFSKHKRWVYPLILIALITPFSSWLDLSIERYFFETKQFVTNEWTDGLFDFGVMPAQVVALLAVFFYLLSFVHKYWKMWRPACLVLILTMAVGEGFIIHAVLKDHWGRPRPKQVEEFGGMQEFRPYYKPNFFHQPEPSKSFVCGHCGMGFFFLAFILIGERYKQKWLVWFGLLFGLSLGFTMGISRMAQGGHFLTDVLWAGMIIWITAVVSDYLVFNQEGKYEGFNKTPK